MVLTLKRVTLLLAPGHLEVAPPAVWISKAAIANNMGKVTSTELAPRAGMRCFEVSSVADDKTGDAVVDAALEICRTFGQP